MLQPRKKLTKKEMRRDPLLESVEKGRHFYERNKRNINTGIIVLIVLILLGWGWQNNRASSRDEALFASTKAVAAYMNGNQAGAQDALQSVSDQFNAKDGTALSVYFLGVTKLDSNLYDAATIQFNTLVQNTDSPILKAAGLLKLAYIKEIQEDFTGAAQLYEKASKIGEYASKNEALIAAGYNYQRAGKMDDARRVVQTVDDKKMTTNLLDSFRYLQGMIGS